MITIKINNQEIKAAENISVLKASLDAGIYIPHLCSHPDLDGYKCLLCSGGLAPSEEIYRGGLKVEHKPSEKEPGCKLCLIEINPVRDRSSQRDDRPAVEKNSDSARCPNKALLSNAKPNISNGIKGIDGLQKACATIIIPDMEILTDTERIRQARQENLAKILAEHPHSCLTCAQSEGCSLTQCSSNVPQNERCCPKFNRCELQKVSQYIGIHLSTPRYIPQSIPIIEDEPLFKRNYNLCIGCLRCVRACRNLRGVDALGFVINPVRSKTPEASALPESIRGVTSNGVNNDKIIVGSKQPTLKDSACKFCGACVEVCPTGAISDTVLIGSDRAKSLVPCQGACPIGMDIPDYVRLIKDNQIDKAFEIIQHKVPFPSVLGRVCFHPCEENCRRKELNEPISICGLKRYATEFVTTDEHRQPSSIAMDYGVGRLTQIIDNNKNSDKIAVIGAGPAGLTAAYYLAQKGYAVSVFEANNEVGGMMRYAIPEYRLPLAVLSNDLKKITDHKNISIKTNSRLGTGFTIESLKKEGYKAILIAIGAQLPKKINIPFATESQRTQRKSPSSPPLLKGDEGGFNPSETNRGKETIFWGIDFLKSIRKNLVTADLADSADSTNPDGFSEREPGTGNQHNPLNLRFQDKSVLVIGGGNVAIDVALSAKRLGAKNIQLVCLESREIMPAHKWEIEQAAEEGINLNCSWGPIGIRDANCELGIGNSGNPKSAIRNTKFALDFVQCASVFDPNGKFNPSFNSNVCKTFQADIVIVTIGQMPDTEKLALGLNPNKTIKTDENTLMVQDNLPTLKLSQAGLPAEASAKAGVFACGEVVHNPSSIIESIADGRKAAENIDKYLGGDGIIDSLLETAKPNPYLGRDESFNGYQRIKMPCISEESISGRPCAIGRSASGGNLAERNNNFNPAPLERSIHPVRDGNVSKQTQSEYTCDSVVSNGAGRDKDISSELKHNGELSNGVGSSTGLLLPVESGYTKEMAQNEARRCLQCDMRLTISPVIFPPETSRKGHAPELEFTGENIKTAPAKEGVYILMDENKNTMVIKGAMNLQESLAEQITKSKAKYFRYEIEPMFTKKESELIQKYLQEHGKLPAGGDELEDLY